MTVMVIKSHANDYKPQHRVCRNNGIHFIVNEFSFSVKHPQSKMNSSPGTMEINLHCGKTGQLTLKFNLAKHKSTKIKTRKPYTRVYAGFTLQKYKAKQRSNGFNYKFAKNFTF